MEQKKKYLKQILSSTVIQILQLFGAFKNALPIHFYHDTLSSDLILDCLGAILFYF